MEPIKEYCREELGPEAGYQRCNEPAEYLLWGKLFPPSALVPRCYDHAAEHAGHYALTPHGLSQGAILDLRRLFRDDPEPYTPECGLPLVQGGTDAFCTRPRGHADSCVWGGDY